MTDFVLLDAGQPAEVGASFGDDGAWIDATDIETALGWSLRPEGLCREDICIPVAHHPGLLDDGTINLEALAELLGRPLALSVERRAAYIGLPMASFDQTVGNLEAPDFTLPDLSGNLHSLSDHRGSKVLLAAWASW
jgi:hypothetical protein